MKKNTHSPKDQCVFVLYRWFDQTDKRDCNNLNFTSIKVSKARIVNLWVSRLLWWPCLTGDAVSSFPTVSISNPPSSRMGLTLVQKLYWLVFSADWSGQNLCRHTVRVDDAHVRCWMNPHLADSTPALVLLPAGDVSCLTATHRCSRNNRDLLLPDIVAQRTLG